MNEQEKEDILYGIKRSGIFLANHQLKGITKVLDARVQEDKVDNILCPECGEFIGVGLLMSKPLPAPPMVRVRPMTEEENDWMDKQREQAQKDFDEEDETHEKNLLAHGFD